MLNRKKTVLQLLVCAAVLPVVSQAQEIKGDTVFVSEDQPATLYFPDPITYCDYGDAVAYNWFDKRIENSMVQVQAKVGGVEPAALTVREGGRTHDIVLQYRKGAPAADYVHDWDNQTKLKNYVVSLNARHGIVPAPADTTLAKSKKTAKASGKKPVAKTGDYWKDKYAEIKSLLAEVPATTPKETASAAKKPTPQSVAKPEAKVVESAPGNDEFVSNGLAATGTLAKKPAPAKPAPTSVAVATPVNKVADTTADEEVSPYDSIISQAANVINEAPYDKAMDLYRQAAALKPDDVFPRRMIKYVETLQADYKEKLRKQQMLEQRAQVVYLTSKANKAIEERKYDSARALFAQVLTLNAAPSQAEYAQKKIETIDLELQRIAARTPPKMEPKPDPELTRRQTRLKRVEDKRRAILNGTYKKEIKEPEPPVQEVAAVEEAPVVDTAAQRAVAEAERLRKEEIAAKKLEKEQRLAQEKADKEKLAKEKSAAAETAKQEQLKREAEKQADTQRSAQLAQTLKDARTNLKQKQYDIAKDLFTKALSLAPSAEQVQEANNALATIEKVKAQPQAPVVAEPKPVASAPKVPEQPVAKIALSTNMQASAIPYTREQLMKRYPEINFDAVPREQTADAATKEERNALFQLSKTLLAENKAENLAESNGDVKLVCQGISFSNNSAYLKLLIQNDGEDDFLAGNMQLTYIKDNGMLRQLNQKFISDFPVVQQGKSYPVVYVADAVNNVNAGDIFIVEITDRLKKNTLTLHLPGSIYREEKKLALGK